MSIIKRQTILGTIFSYVGVFVGILTQAILFTKYLETQEAGLFAMIFNWAMIFIFIANLGFNSAGTKFFDLFRDPKKNHNGYLFSGLLFLSIGSSLVFVIMFLFKDQILSSAVGGNVLFEKYYYYIFPVTISVALFNIFDNYAKGLYDTVMGNFLSQFLQRFLIFLGVLFFILGFYNFENLVILWTLALALPTVFMFIHIIRLGNFSLNYSDYLFKSKFLTEFFRFAGYSIVTGLSSIVITKLDSLFVYEYLGLKNIAVYNFCLLFGSVMTISYNVNLKASTSIVLDAMAVNDLEKVRTIFLKSSLTQLVFGTILLAVVWINIDDLLSFIKPEYSAGKYIILIIGIAKLYDLASGINSLILVYSKYYKIDSFIVLTFIGFLFLLNHLLIPIYGLIGAGLAALIATFYYNSIRNLLIYKLFKIHPYSIKIVWILLTGLICTYIGIYLPRVSDGFIGSAVTIVYKSLVTGILYMVVIYKLKISLDLNQIINQSFVFLKKVLKLS
jgi:O-antigen/teichoic acid export membrane protein